MYRKLSYRREQCVSYAFRCSPLLSATKTCVIKGGTGTNICSRPHPFPSEIR